MRWVCKCKHKMLAIFAYFSGKSLDNETLRLPKIFDKYHLWMAAGHAKLVDFSIVFRAGRLADHFWIFCKDIGRYCVQQTTKHVFERRIGPQTQRLKCNVHWSEFQSLYFASSFKELRCHRKQWLFDFSRFVTKVTTKVKIYLLEKAHCYTVSLGKVLA